MEPTSFETSSARSTRSRPVGAIVLWLAVAGVQVALGLGALLLRDQDVPRDGLYSYANAVGGALVFLLLLGLTVWAASLAGGVRETLGLRSFAGKWVWAALGVVLLAGLAAFLIQWVLDLDAAAEQGILPEEWRPERAGAVAANAVLIVVLAPVVEELFYRGAGVRILSSFGPAVAIAVTSVAFALAHGLLVGFVPLVLFAVGLAWVRLRAESVWPCIVAHALYNGTVLAIGLGCLANPECAQNLACAL